jgi:hypothetical protein
MFDLKKWVEANRPKKHRTIVVFILMLVLVATATNNNPQDDEQNVFPKKTKLNRELNLEVYRNNNLLFSEVLTPGVEITLLGETKDNLFLAEYKGETFQIMDPSESAEESPDFATADALTEGDQKVEKEVGTEWVVETKKYKNPKIVKTFPLSVMVRHDGGVDFIDKNKIPNKEIKTTPLTSTNLNHKDSKNTVSSQCNGATTWLKLKKFMDLQAAPNTPDLSIWGIEHKILEQGKQNADAGRIMNYEYLGLAELVLETSQINREGTRTISIEGEFRKHGIKGRQQEPDGCGVATLSTALEFLLKEENPKTEVPWAKTKSLVINHTGSKGRIGLAYAMGPEIISAHGIKTNQGTEKRKIRVRGIYKFFIFNRDEYPNQTLSNNPLAFQTKAVEKIISNELLNKRPVLASVTTGPEDKSQGSIGPDFGKNNYSHAVVVVGIEKLSDGKAPFRLRVLNSWGDKWGEEGYGWLYPSKITGLYSIELL